MMPNVLVMRPADAVETAECWEIALRQKDRPTVLALSRQGLPQVRNAPEETGLCARGAYRLKKNGNAPKVTLVASGSEVHVALECAEQLEKQGVGAQVVSMVCTELFDEQEDAYRSDILPDNTLKVSIEAGTTFGWERYTMAGGLRIGIDSFGTSAPAPDAFEHFGFTSEAIVPKILAKLEA